MSFIGNMFDGSKGAGFQAGGQELINPAVQGQQQTAYGQTQQGLQQQQNFVNALQGQNGIQNQSNVFSQLQGVASGQGPNPAAAMLSQATGANVANQAALMAGQRGTSANAGMMARQAAQQGASTQQQAAGQGATMQANQSLGALGQMGNMAGQQVAQQAGALQGYNAAAQGQQQNLAQQQGQNIGMQSNINNANAGIAGANVGAQQGLLGGLLGGAGAAMGVAAQGGAVSSLPMLAGGGPVSTVGKFLSGMGASGGTSENPITAGMTQLGGGIGSMMRRPAANPVAGPGAQQMAGGPMDNMGQAPAQMPQMVAAKGGKVPALVSPGERYLSPRAVQEVAQGQKSPMKAGEKIPGKPKVGGAKDSYANDTVPKTLESGGIVIPRHITQGDNAPAKAAEFVRAILAKQGLRK